MVERDGGGARPGALKVPAHYRFLTRSRPLSALRALAVIGGLAVSTPVTLLVVPGLYAAIKRRKSA